MNPVIFPIRLEEEHGGRDLAMARFNPDDAADTLFGSGHDGADHVIAGGGLERKTAEPIANAHGVSRKPIQFFVGSGEWDDEAVMAQLRRHVVALMGDARAATTRPAGTQAAWGRSVTVERLPTDD